MISLKRIRYWVCLVGLVGLMGLGFLSHWLGFVMRAFWDCVLEFCFDIFWICFFLDFLHSGWFLGIFSEISINGIRDVKVRWHYAWSLFLQIHALGRVPSLIAFLKSRVCCNGQMCKKHNGGTGDMEKRKIEEFRGKRMESFYFAVYKGEEGKWPQTCGSYNTWTVLRVHITPLRLESEEVVSSCSWMDDRGSDCVS